MMKKGKGYLEQVKETDKSFKVITAALRSFGKLLIINSKSINTPYYI